MARRWNWEGTPPEEAYSRVTEPARFVPIQEAARRDLQRLTADYEVRREEVAPRSPSPEHEVWDLEVVRLVPEGGGAPMTWHFTNFPSVVVDIGRGHRAIAPVCGCDACDEDPDEEVELLLEQVDAIVNGGLSEWGDRTGHRYRLDRVDGHQSGVTSFEPAEKPYLVRWPAWRRRT